MNDTTAAFAVLTGLVLRLAVPVLITGILVVVLSRLDRRWQHEGSVTPLKVQKPDCWKANRCSASKRKSCPGYRSSQPCWQVFRHSNGYLAEKCLACPVLVKAPVPAHA